MKILIAILIVTTIYGCATSAVSSVSQELCTVEDQEAGLCDGPAGGWASLAQHTVDYGASQQPGAAAASPDCWTEYTPSARACRTKWNFGNYVLVTTCRQYEGSDDYHCSSFNCPVSSCG